MTMKEKIQALMAKAMSAGVTDAEAEAFMSKARQLMDKYGISEAELKEAAATEESWRWYTTEARETRHGFAFHPVDRNCCTVVAAFVGCVVYQEKTTDGLRLKWYGLDQEVELAQWIMISLKKQYDFDWSNFLHLERKRKSLRAIPDERKAFTIGFADALQRRLKGWSKKQDKSQSNALVVQKRELALNRLKEEHGIHLGRATGSKWTGGSAEAMAAGATSAQAASIGRGVKSGTIAIGAR